MIEFEQRALLASRSMVQEEATIAKGGRKSDAVVLQAKLNRGDALSGGGTGTGSGGGSVALSMDAEAEISWVYYRWSDGVKERALWLRGLAIELAKDAVTVWGTIVGIALIPLPFLYLAHAYVTRNSRSNVMAYNVIGALMQSAPYADYVSARFSPPRASSLGSISQTCARTASGASTRSSSSRSC